MVVGAAEGGVGGERRDERRRGKDVYRAACLGWDWGWGPLGEKEASGMDMDVPLLYYCSLASAQHFFVVAVVL